MKKPIPNFSFTPLINVEGDEGRLARLSAPIERLLRDFSGLGKVFLNQIIRKVQESGCAVETKAMDLYSLHSLLSFLSAIDLPAAERIRRQLQSGQFLEILPEDASVLERSFEKDIRQKAGENVVKAAKDILRANKAIQIMFNAKVWPYTLRLNPIKIPAGIKKSKASLLESLIQNANQKSAEALTDSEKDAAIKAALGFLGIDHASRMASLTSLIVQGESECLKRIRDELALEIQGHFEVHKRASSLIGQVDDVALKEIEDWFDFYMGSKESGPLATKFSRARGLFWQSPNAINNYLAAIKLFYFNGEGSIIRRYPKDKLGEIGFYFRTLKRVYLGQEFREHFPEIKPLYNLLEDFFCPSPDLVIKVALLLMAETGMNRTPSLGLQKDMVRPDDEPGWLSIASWKDRAGGTLIYENIYLSRPGEKISSGSAIRRLIEFHEGANYGVELSNKFTNQIFYTLIGFISEGTPRFSGITADYVTPIFNKVVSEAFGENVKLVPSSMRVSLLTIERASSGDITTASIKAAHKSIDTTSKHYGGKFGHLFKFENIASIRDFQDGMQEIAFGNARFSNNSDESRISEIVTRTGLGTLCMRMPKDANEVSSCINFQDCPNCASLKISINPNDLADLLEWSDYLCKQKEVILIRKGDAWENKWIFWTQLVEEIIEVGPRSIWAKNLRKAKELLKTRTPTVYPALW